MYKRQGDTRVAYWESAKMIAKLREFRKNNNKLFFDINLHAGHGGASSRDEALLEKAREYAFILVE